MKEGKSTKRNILIWTLSLVIAVVLWGYVVFILNPEGETEVRGIPVEFIGEQSLTGRNRMLTGGREETVAVRITGRMQNFAGINKETVTAVVDLSKTNTVGDNILMQYELRGPPELDTLTVHRIDPFVSIAIDDVESKYVDLRLDFAGEVAEDYGCDPAIFDPARIHITGPATLVGTVHYAEARFSPPDPVTRTVNIPVDYSLYTESGELVDSKYITKDIEEAWLTLPVYMVKTVPLSINFIDGGGLAADKNIGYEINPPSVRISGDPERLAEINAIPIAQIKLEALTGDHQEIYAIQFPDDVKNLDNISDAQASVRIFGVGTLDIDATNISLKGLVLPDGYTYTIVSYPITVTLRGPEDELARIDPVNVRVVADFTDEVITAGRRYRRTAAPPTVEGSETVGVVDKGYEVIIDIIPISEEPL